MARRRRKPRAWQVELESRVANLESLCVDYYRVIEAARLGHPELRPDAEAWLRRQLDGLGKEEPK